MGVCEYGWMNERVNGWVSVYMNELADRLMDGLMFG